MSLPNISYTVDENKVYYNPYVEPTQPNDEIWYTSTDGNIVTPESTTPFLDASGSNIPIISNTYKNGKGIIKLEKDCYHIGNDAFYGCTSLISLTIPNKVTSFYFSTFSSCTSLTGITIPDSVTSISDYAFQNCTSLTGITIPDSVTTIGEGAFYGCSKLSSITVLRKTPPTLNPVVFVNIASNAKIYVPSASKDAYKSAEMWSSYASQIQAIQE